MTERASTSPRTLGAILLIVLAVGAGWFLHGVLDGAADDAGEGDDAPAVDPSSMRAEVVTTEVVAGDLPRVIVTMGRVKSGPHSTTNVTSRIGGRVIETALLKGQRLQPGDVLLRLDPSSSEVAAAQAKATAAQAERRLTELERGGRDSMTAELESTRDQAVREQRLAREQLERIETLNRDGLLSDKDLEIARADLERATAAEKLTRMRLEVYQETRAPLERQALAAANQAARVDLARAQMLLSETVVRSPVGGQVIVARTSLGDVVEPGALIATVLTDDERLIEFAVSPRQAVKIVAGARARWRNDGDEWQRGQVVEVLDRVNDGTGLITVVVEPQRGTRLSRVGLTVRGEIELERVHDVISVPEAAVVRSDDALVVVRVTADDIARVTPVEVVVRYHGDVGIRGDVHAGDRVIVKGAFNLPDGAGIVERKAESNGLHR